MAVRVIKRTTNEGVRYSISGLTFDQMFRIKNAMYAEAEKMKAISEEFSTEDEKMGKEFERFSKDALAVAEAVSIGI